MSEQDLSAESKADLALEIGHLLFIDVVGYSKLLVNDQIELIKRLNGIVRGTETFRRAEASKKLIRLPTGDGMVLIFYRSPEEPVRCAQEISEGITGEANIRLRMGIHSGLVNQVLDVNDQMNIAGAAINIGQRVMDCGDAGHILISKHVADDLTQYARWRPYLHDLGECEVKHGLRLHLFNFAKDNLGNLQLPQKFRRGRRWKPTETPVRRVARNRWAPFGLAALILTGAIAVGFFVLHRPAASKIENSIAVLPFLDLSENKDQEYFSDGITEQITTSLAQIHGLFVVARTSAFAFKNKNNIREIGEKLHVQNVLEGSVMRGSGKTRIDAQLINVASGYHIWSKTYDSTAQDVDILTLQSDVAEKVASALQVELHISDAKRVETPPTSDPEALELYMRGRYLLQKRTPDSIQRGQALFEQAVTKDPHFALGHTGIADSYVLLGKIGAMPPSEAASHAWSEVSAALAINDQLADGLVSRAILLNDFEWNWPAAEADYRKALEIDPNNADGYHWYARSLAEFGRTDEALHKISAAQKQDPLSPTVRATKAKILLVARRYDRAVEQCRQALELEPNFASAFTILGQACLFNKQPAEGIEAVKKYVELSGGSGWAKLELAFAYAITGNKAESERIVRETTTTPGAQYSPYDMATICSAWHDTDHAMEWLKKAVEQRSVDVIWIRVDPRLDNIRSDPRFDEIVKSMVPRKSVAGKSLPRRASSTLNRAGG